MLSGEELPDDNIRICERNGLDRPAMNQVEIRSRNGFQEEFDRRFSYRNECEDRPLRDEVKSAARNCCKPCSSPQAMLATTKKRIPIIDWLPKYNYKANLLPDFIGGITIAIMNVPQGGEGRKTYVFQASPTPLWPV